MGKYKAGERFININGNIIEVACDKGVVIEVKSNNNHVELFLAKEIDDNYVKVTSCFHCKTDEQLERMFKRWEESYKRSFIRSVEVFFRRKYNKLNELYWKIRYFFQRLFKGYDKREIFSFNSYHASYVVKRLTEFNKNLHCYPCCLDIEKWSDIINEIIFAFELCSNDDWIYGCNCGLHEGEINVLEMKRKKGMKLFIEYYDQLWD